MSQVPPTMDDVRDISMEPNMAASYIHLQITMS
jgi:hypothetical protein